MSKPEWGSKRVCQSCGAKYYDFRKREIRCPKCGTVFDPEAVLKSRRARSAPAAKKERPAASKPEAAEADLSEAGEIEADDDALIEDAADLDEGEEEVEVEVADQGDSSET